MPIRASIPVKDSSGSSTPSPSLTTSTSGAFPLTSNHDLLFSEDVETLDMSIIIPVYQEVENLPLCIALITAAMETLQRTSNTCRYEIVVVDDNSTDGTADIACDLMRKFTVPMKFLQRPRKMGLASAYRDALQVCSADLICIMDVDLSHNPKEVPLMYQKIISNPNLDVVQGTRYAQGGGVCGWPLKRIFYSKTANFGAAKILGATSSDLTGSFRIYRRHVLEDIMPRMITSGYTFQMEAMVRIQNRRYAVAEHPIEFVDRIFGESKLGPGEIKNFIVGVVLLFFDL